MHPRAARGGHLRASTSYIFCVFFLLLGCQARDTVLLSSVSLPDIYGHYSVEYDAGEERLSFFVQFRNEGKLGMSIRLTDESYVEVDGQLLTVNHHSNLGTYYEGGSWTAFPKDSYLFAWVVPDGSRYENRLTLPGAIRISSPSPDISHPRNRDLVVSFMGDANRNGETLSAHLETVQTPEPGEEKELIVALRKNPDFVFPKERLQIFPQGRANLFLEREVQSVPYNGHPNSQGLLRSIYRTAKISVTLR